MSTLPSEPRIGVEDADYRDALERHHIHLRDDWGPMPDHVEALVAQMRKERGSPGPSIEELKKDKDLLQMTRGTTKPWVEKYCTTHIFPGASASDTLQKSSRKPMNRHMVPYVADDAGGVPGLTSIPKYSVPAPDLLYGYNSVNAFPDEGHRSHLLSTRHDVRATNGSNRLIYPFFVIEFKGIGGNLRVATNQCLAGAATCVNMAEELNNQLLAYSQDEAAAAFAAGGDQGQGGGQVVHAVDSTAFSIAMSGSEVWMYVSWKHDELSYYTQQVDAFVLYHPEHYINFRRMVRNIIDWGKNDRLKAIRRTLDALLEESRKRTAAESKARQPSPEIAGDFSGMGGSSSGPSKKHRS
ncbi:hypothetical protein SCUCBS95973_007481 [Sporothrix curviconia]|uniref:DUF7924 domain-containing protein n=1 Tax=Sporothrix curviconia TaxID=1260050 RepID=A0ABP0CDM3_9PEZI